MTSDFHSVEFSHLPEEPQATEGFVFWDSQVAVGQGVGEMCRDGVRSPGAGFPFPAAFQGCKVMRR